MRWRRGMLRPSDDWWSVGLAREMLVYEGFGMLLDVAVGRSWLWCTAAGVGEAAT